MDRKDAMAPDVDSATITKNLTKIFLFSKFRKLTPSPLLALL